MQNVVLSPEMVVLVKFCSTVRGDIRHSEEAKKGCRKNSCVQLGGQKVCHKKMKSDTVYECQKTLWVGLNFELMLMLCIHLVTVARATEFASQL